MKVVHISWDLAYGGIETMLINIANAQIEAGAEVHVIILNDLYAEELMQAFDSKVIVYLMHRKCGSKGLQFAIKLNHLLMKLNPDAIHLHWSNIYHLLWHKRLSRVASVTQHDLPTGPVRREGILYRVLPILNLNNSGNVTFIDEMPQVYAISNAVQEALWNDYAIRSIVVNNGILASKFKLRDNRKKSNPLKVVMVSRLEHNKKGQDLLLQAVAMLRGNVCVDFIGDGSSREYLEKLTREMHVESSVRFLGIKPQPYIAAHLCEYDLFVQPSRWEGFGLTVAEAMAAKVPVLASAGQGPAEVICGNKYGWLFENGNAEDLARQLSYIAEHYEEALMKAERALQYVYDTYDVSLTAGKYLELYKKQYS